MASDFIFRLHYPYNGPDPSLFSEPYVSRSHGTGIAVVIVVTLIWDQVLYVCFPVCQRYNHDDKIK